MIKKYDPKLRVLLKELVDIVKTHGKTRDEQGDTLQPIKDFIKKHQDVPKFPEFAATIMLFIEDPDGIDKFLSSILS